MLFDKQEINFGTVKPGDSRTAVFTYTGSSPIISHWKSCGCTSLEVKGNIITAVVNYYSKKRDYEKSITVTVKTQDEVIHILKVKANVKNSN